MPTGSCGFIEGSYKIRLIERGMVLFVPPTPAAPIPKAAQSAARLRAARPDADRAVRKPFHMIAIMHALPTGPNNRRFEWLGTTILPFGRRAS